MKAPVLIGLSLFCCAVIASDSTATQLVFEPATGAFGDFGFLPQGYGNRVTATTQDGFLYDLSGGATPNVVTAFGAAAGLVDLFTWSSDFGDLQHAIIAREPYEFEFRLVADPGYLVTLNSFDMAGWPHLDFVIASVYVVDGSGVTRFSQDGVTIYGNSTGPQHTHFSLAGVSAPELRLKFDARTDGLGHVVDSDDVGIDNINFSQVGTAGVPDAPDAAVLSLAPGVPNPFLALTNLRYRLAERGAVSLRVYDPQGRLVRALVDDEVQSAGDHQATWDGRSAAGARLPAGLYLARLTSQGRSEMRKLVMSR